MSLSLIRSLSVDKWQRSKPWLCFLFVRRWETAALWSTTSLWMFPPTSSSLHKAAGAPKSSFLHFGCSTRASTNSPILLTCLSFRWQRSLHWGNGREGGRRPGLGSSHCLLHTSSEWPNFYMELTWILTTEEACCSVVGLSPVSLELKFLPPSFSWCKNASLFAQFILFRIEICKFGMFKMFAFHQKAN